MRSQQAGRVFVICLFVLTSYLLYLIISPFLQAIAWAAFLAIAFYPVYLHAVRLLRGRCVIAAILTTLLVTALILVPAVYVVSSLATTVVGYLPELRDKLAFQGEATIPFPGEPETEKAEEAGRAIAESVLQNGTAEEGAQGEGDGKAASAKGPKRSSFGFLHSVEIWLSQYVDMSGIDLEGYAFAVLGKLGGFVAERSSALLGNALQLLTTFLLTIFMTGVFLLKGAALGEFLERFIPLSEADRTAVWVQLREMTRAIFYGVMMTAAIQALVGTIGWKIAGLPSATLFGVAMFFCALIPIGGAALVWFPGAIWLFLRGSPGWGIFMLLWGFFAVSMLDNFLRPVFISGRTKVPMIPVLLAIFGGVAAFGMTGLFVGPLVVTLFLILLDVLRRDYFAPEMRPGASLAVPSSGPFPPAPPPAPPP